MHVRYTVFRSTILPSKLGHIGEDSHLGSVSGGLSRGALCPTATNQGSRYSHTDHSVRPSKAHYRLHDHLRHNVQKPSKAQ